MFLFQCPRSQWSNYSKIKQSGRQICTQEQIIEGSLGLNTKQEKKRKEIFYSRNIQGTKQ